MNMSYKFYLLLFVCCLKVQSPTSDTVGSARIVNGFEVDITDVPYQASLRRSSGSSLNIIWSHICGAIIISNRHILTAAHCVTSFSSPSYLGIEVGTNSGRSGGISYNISSFAAHKEYASATFENDIALLKTVTVIAFSSSVRPIALAKQDSEISSGSEALVSGYGRTSYGGIISEVLLAARVNIVDQQTCSQAYDSMVSITKGMICANGFSPLRDACQGDSGGPLVVQNYLIGIVSFGEGCGEAVYPGVYTRISEYNDWITNHSKTLK